LRDQLARQVVLEVAPQHAGRNSTRRTTCATRRGAWRRSRATRRARWSCTRGARPGYAVGALGTLAPVLGTQLHVERLLALVPHDRDLQRLALLEAAKDLHRVLGRRRLAAPDVEDHVAVLELQRSVLGRAHDQEAFRRAEVAAEARRQRDQLHLRPRI